jgi:hypothetical protein
MAHTCLMPSHYVVGHGLKIVLCSLVQGCWFLEPICGFVTSCDEKWHRTHAIEYVCVTVKHAQLHRCARQHQLNGLGCWSVFETTVTVNIVEHA